MGLPNRANVGRHSQAIARMAGREEAWLVLDNFQSFMPALPRAFLSALINHHRQGLHVVILSHYLRPLQELAVEPVLLITQSQLCLTQEDLRRLFAQNGLQLSVEAAKTLFQRSQGWPVQGWLCLRRALAEGRLNQTVGLEETLDQLVWQKTGRDDQICLMAFSFFESLTPPMLCCLTGAHEVPQPIRLLLGSLPLVSQSPGRDRYDLHQLLRNYLQRKLAQALPQAARQACRRAAAWYLRAGDRAGAADCYWRMGDWEALLQLDVRGLYQARLGCITFEEAAAQIALEAPDELVARYPLPMLYMAYCLYGACQFELFGRVMQRLHDVIWAGEDLHLMGEWTLISIFEVFPDLEEMRAAWAGPPN